MKEKKEKKKTITDGSLNIFSTVGAADTWHQFGAEATTGMESTGTY